MNNKGVRDDLMELVKLPFVKSYTARMIYNTVRRPGGSCQVSCVNFLQGLRSIAAVAAAEANDLIPILEAVGLSRSLPSLIVDAYLCKTGTATATEAEE